MSSIFSVKDAHGDFVEHPIQIQEAFINHNQSAFIPRRNITDNILLSHDLFRNFHMNKEEARMALKIDLGKAFNMVNWDFLVATLNALKFLSMFTNWIMECATGAAFFILINGEPCGFFKSSRGLQQVS